MDRAAARPRAGGLNESHRLQGMALIAPAVDFTEKLIWPQLPEAVRSEIETKGCGSSPRRLCPPYPLTRSCSRTAAHICCSAGHPHLLPGRHPPGHGRPDVPWRHAMTLIEHLAADPATITLIRDGDHRLSRPQDLDALQKAIELRVDANAA